METSRRIFIKTAAIAGAGIALIPGCTPGASKPKVGLQLYTVRDQMSKDPQGTLAQVAKVGYNWVETAGYGDGKMYGLDAATFKKALGDLGLENISAHMSLDVFRNGFDQALDFMVATDQKYVVLPWMKEEDRATIDQFKSHAALLNASAEKAKQAGIQVCYHNHDFEFRPIDEQLPMDILLSETDPKLVKFELDLYWISKMDLDPVAFFEQNKGRVALWHVKDLANTPERGFAEVGTGTIDFPRIFKNQGVSGMKYFFVEQDQSADPMKSIGISYKNLTESILA